MKWRCEWCGKPHERNDPPCDECGHHSYERAVVPKAPDEEVEDFVWVCTECGRAHPRNSPPCSRCGNMQFERQSPETLDPGEIGGGRWLDVVEWQHVVGGVLVLLLASVLVAGWAGAIDLPGAGPPTVSDVPGDADHAGNLSLSAVETGLLDRLDEKRAEAGSPALERGGGLDRVAEYYTKRRVKADYGDGELPDLATALDEFDTRCGRKISIAEYPGPEMSADAFDSEASLAELFATTLGGELRSSSYEHVGVDFHEAPDGTLYATVLAC